MYKEKTIKWMIIISLILGLIYLFAFTCFITVQKKLAASYSLVYEDIENASFVLPFGYVTSILQYIIQATISLVILSKLKDVYSTRAFEIVGIVLFSGAFSFLGRFISNMQFLANKTQAEVLTLNAIFMNLDYVSFLAKISGTLFIAACAMSWYGKSYARNH